MPVGDFVDGGVMGIVAQPGDVDVSVAVEQYYGPLGLGDPPLIHVVGEVDFHSNLCPEPSPVAGDQSVTCSGLPRLVDLDGGPPGQL